jgi:hypothetical protein
MNHSPTYLLWFGRFKQGCLWRIGQDVWQDWSITLPAMNELMDLLEGEWYTAQNQSMKAMPVVAGPLAVTAFCGSFRGNKVFLVHLFGLNTYLMQLEGRDYIVVPLLGRFKGALHARYHLQPLVAKTDPGLNVRVWVECLASVKHESRQENGPALEISKGRSCLQR